MFFKLTKEDAGGARLGELDFGVSRPRVATPVFMPVGTRASVKALWQDDIDEIGYSLILANLYHLHLRPGEELIRDMGGLRRFMAYDGNILTDSGGFQVFSLGDNVRIHSDRVEFRSHLDGAKITFTPEEVLRWQGMLGSDIAMVLDDCPPWPAEPERLRLSVERTVDWARRSFEYYTRSSGASRPFAIIQGGMSPEARRYCAEKVCGLDFPGFALGGLSVGEPKPLFLETLRFSAPLLPRDKPRYLMGVGTIPDILDGVRAGIDMFDCVLPTRNARRGQVFTSRGKINLRNQKYARGDQALDPGCACKVCRRYGVGYLRHLFHVEEIAALGMATYHTLFFIHRFMENLRAAIQAGHFEEFYLYWKNLYGN